MVLYLKFFFSGGRFKTTSWIALSASLGCWRILSSSFYLFFSWLHHLITSNEHFVSCSLASCFLFWMALSLSYLSLLALHRLVFDRFLEGFIFERDLFDFADWSLPLSARPYSNHTRVNTCLDDNWDVLLTPLALPLLLLCDREALLTLSFCLGDLSLGAMFAPAV